jgi:hypothetical protein
VTDLAGASGRVPWCRTTRWRPSRNADRSGVSGPVEHPVTGEVGYAKLSSLPREWIASTLAREVGVNVPEFRIGRLEGHDGLIGVSLAWGAESLSLADLRARGRSADPAVQAALRAASGLLPFQVWLLVHNGQDWHLMVSEAADGTIALAAVDFTPSLCWFSHRLPAQLPQPAATLRLGADPERVAATVARIEACADARIAEIVQALPLDVLSWAPQDHPPEQEGWWRHWYVRGLQWRRAAVRGAMERAGWMMRPDPESR